MHIMEGFLPLQWCIVWWIIALPCLMLGIYQLKKLVDLDREALPLLGVTGGFIFILSSLKLPSVTGSCSHPTGTGLSTISFGPWITSVICMIVLLFQSLFLAHGGLSVLGAEYCLNGDCRTTGGVWDIQVTPQYTGKYLHYGIPGKCSCGYVYLCDDVA